MIHFKWMNDDRGTHTSPINTSMILLTLHHYAWLYSHTAGKATGAPRNSSGSASRKQCTIHPGLTSHNTSECRLAAKASSGSTSTGSSASSKSPIVCYHCEEPGHLRPDCPKLKSAPPSHSSASHQQWRSPSPTSTTTATKHGTTPAVSRSSDRVAGKPAPPPSSILKSTTVNEDIEHV